jgi:D-amino-acid dehydrogenase
LKALKWMFDAQAPLLFRPQLDWQQWRWACNSWASATTAPSRAMQQIVALGAYSHTALQQMVAETGISYHRLERGIAHFYSSAQAFEEAGEAEMMRQHGVQRQLVSRDELLRIEPAFTPYKDQIFGGTFTPTDESGDARAFTQQLAQLCAQRGVQFLYGHDVLRLNQAGGEVQSITVRQRLDDGPGREQTLTADSFVVACGSYSAPLLRRGRGPAHLPRQGLQRHLPHPAARCRAVCVVH